MAKIKVSTKGLADSLEQLAQLGKDLDAAASQALLAGGEILKAGMVQRVPKNTHNLENHIGIDGPTQDGNFIFIEVGVIGADATTTRYGNAQEYGTSSMPAQSYVRSTVESDKSQASKAMLQALREAMTP